jgi:LysM repeat protein
MPARPHTNLKLLVLRMLVVMAALAAVFFLLTRPGAADQPPPPTQIHVVAPGDNLWKIAGSVATPGDDVRPLIAAIIDINQLEDATIVPGQQLRVPVG